MSDRRIVDADVHHHYPTASALAEYLPDGDSAPYYTFGSGLPNPRGAFRTDAYPPGGGPPASDPQHVIDHHLDPYGIERAVLNCGSTLYLGGLPDPDLAASLARATNDWTIAEWLDYDERFLGTIVVSPRDPEQAAAEVRRLGGDPRMVQVGVTSSPVLLGNEFLHPIYEACDELGLPFNLHVGGADVGINSGSFAVGGPTTFLEHHVGMCIPAIHHLISMVTEGVFVKYPNTKLVLNEFGVAWLPFVMWRMDMEYRAGREDMPWLTDLPSRHIREFVRFTTQPLEVPERPQDLITLLGLIGAEDMLVYSSDYPHWDFDSPDYALKGFSDEWKEKILYNNPRELFRLDEALVPTAGAR
jgi:predicted TIM-barrel fold metal-dependent hydrolase